MKEVAEAAQVSWHFVDKHRQNRLPSLPEHTKSHTDRHARTIETARTGHGGYCPIFRHARYTRPFEPNTQVRKALGAFPIDEQQRAPANTRERVQLQGLIPETLWVIKIV